MVLSKEFVFFTEVISLIKNYQIFQGENVYPKDKQVLFRATHPNCGKTLKV
jgi:hypothetical protein